VSPKILNVEKILLTDVGKLFLSLKTETIIVAKNNIRKTPTISFLLGNVGVVCLVAS